jgi:hypothetical protein
MSRRELADAVNAYIFKTTNRVYALDAHYVGRLERGVRRWPNADYRAAFRAVLAAATDAELGFYRTHRNGDDISENIGGSSAGCVGAPIARDVTHGGVTHLVVDPDSVVIVVPTDHPVLLALADGRWTGG